MILFVTYTEKYIKQAAERFITKQTPVYSLPRSKNKHCQTPEVLLCSFLITTSMYSSQNNHFSDFISNHFLAFLSSVPPEQALRNYSFPVHWTLYKWYHWISLLLYLAFLFNIMLAWVIYIASLLVSLLCFIPLYAYTTICWYISKFLFVTSSVMVFILLGLFPGVAFWGTYNQSQ